MPKAIKMPNENSPTTIAHRAPDPPSPGFDFYALKSSHTRTIKPLPVPLYVTILILSYKKQYLKDFDLSWTHMILWYFWFIEYYFKQIQHSLTCELIISINQCSKIKILSYHNIWLLYESILILKLQSIKGLRILW